MPKYGRQRDRASRRAGRDAKRQAELDAGWKRPPNEECIERTFDYPLSATMKYVDRTVWTRRENMLVEFAVTLVQLDAEGVWREVLCIDTCNHGTVHRHRDNHGEPETIVEVTSARVIQEQHGLALDEVCDRYEKDWGI